MSFIVAPQEEFSVRKLHDCQLVQYMHFMGYTVGDAAFRAADRFKGNVLLWVIVKIKKPQAELPWPGEDSFRRKKDVVNGDLISNSYSNRSHAPANEFSVKE